MKKFIVPAVVLLMSGNSFARKFKDNQAYKQVRFKVTLDMEDSLTKKSTRLGKAKGNLSVRTDFLRRNNGERIEEENNQKPILTVGNRQFKTLEPSANNMIMGAIAMETNHSEYINRYNWYANIQLPHQAMMGILEELSQKKSKKTEATDNIQAIDNHARIQFLTTNQAVDEGMFWEAVQAQTGTLSTDDGKVSSYEATVQSIMADPNKASNIAVYDINVYNFVRRKNIHRVAKYALDASSDTKWIASEDFFKLKKKDISENLDGEEEEVVPMDLGNEARTLDEFERKHLKVSYRFAAPEGGKTLVLTFKFKARVRL